MAQTFTTASMGLAANDNSGNKFRPGGLKIAADLTELYGKVAVLESDTVADHEAEFDHDLIATAVQNETDPVFTASPAASITNDDITTLGNTSGTNTGDQDLSSYIKITALTSITLTQANWTLSGGLYEYVYSNVAFTTGSVANVIPENASISVVKAAEVLPKTVTGSGTLTMYATNQPTTDITVNINIFKP